MSNNIEQKLFTAGTFIDLTKAFDSLDHSILLDKLSYYGVRDLPLHWLGSYLSKRSHYVSINDVNSDLISVSNGVPQGSILGPLLFNIYINDIVRSSETLKFILFVDDTAILLAGDNVNNLAVSMNAEIVHVLKWLTCNKLQLNFKKLTSFYLDLRSVQILLIFVSLLIIIKSLELIL